MCVKLTSQESDLLQFLTEAEEIKEIGHSFGGPGRKKISQLLIRINIPIPITGFGGCSFTATVVVVL